MSKKEDANPKVFKDKCGISLMAGDFIIYGHALGRCAGLRYGKVLGIKEGNTNGYSDSKSTLQVQGVDDDWSYEGSKVTLCRKSVLQFQKRVLRIDKEQMPVEIQKLLGEVPLEETVIKTRRNRLMEVED